MNDTLDFESCRWNLHVCVFKCDGRSFRIDVTVVSACTWLDLTLLDDTSCLVDQMGNLYKATAHSMSNQHTIH